MSGKKVVGVSYGEGVGAPRVVLKGALDEAELILAAGRAHDVPVVQSAALVDGLYRTPIGFVQPATFNHFIDTPIDAPVDKALFPVMAALLAHVVAVDKHAKEQER